MIITVALNPALDQTVEVEHFAPADTNRVLDMRFDIGGKGINVARVLKTLGFEALATGFAAGARGRQIIEQLEDSGIGCDFIYVPGETRTNITVLDRATHTHTQLALPGPEVGPEAGAQLRDRLRRRVREGGWLVLAGSIPPPGDPAIYTDLIRMADEHGTQTALDADGPIVKAVLDAGAHPTLLKINDHELARLTRQTIEDEDEALQAARLVREWGVPNVVVTLGSDGAIAVTADGDFLVRPPYVDVVSAVGAGDAFTGGLICGLMREHDWAYALALAAAAGSATCQTPGTMLCEGVDVIGLVAKAVVERIPMSAATR